MLQHSINTKRIFYKVLDRFFAAEATITFNIFHKHLRYMEARANQKPGNSANGNKIKMEELEGAISCVTKGGLTGYSLSTYAVYLSAESPKNKLLVEQSLRTISFYAQSRGLLPDQIKQLLCHIGSCQKGGKCYLNRGV